MHLAAKRVQVVADPNVLVSAAVTPDGVCAELLSRIVLSPVELVVSPLLLDELERVLSRSRFEAIPGSLRVGYIEYLRRIGRLEDDPPAPGGMSLVETDPGDDYLVRLTLAVERRLLVSGDPHLLALAGRYPVVGPRDLLDRLV